MKASHNKNQKASNSNFLQIPNASNYFFPKNLKISNNNKKPHISKKVNEIYNSISNIYSSSEINRGLEELPTFKERIMLVDTIIQRREEIKRAEEIEKINKLTPLINKLKNKYISSSFRNKKKEDSSSTSSGSQSVLLETASNHYRRFSLKGKTLLQIDPIKERAKNRMQTNILPKIEEKNEKIANFSSNEQQEITTFCFPENKETKKNSENTFSIPSIQILEATENNITLNEKSKENIIKSQKRRASLLTVITKFNQTEADKKTSKNQKSQIKDLKNTDPNIYEKNFHLIPIDSPRPSDSNFKKYEVTNQSSVMKSKKKFIFDQRKIEESLEKKLLKFMTKNKEEIPINFLNLTEPYASKNLLTIESKVKEKMKILSKQEKIHEEKEKNQFITKTCSRFSMKNEKDFVKSGNIGKKHRKFLSNQMATHRNKEMYLY